MKVNVYSKNGVLLKEFGLEPGESSSEEERLVSECLRMNDTLTKLTFGDDLYPRISFIHGETIIITY